ncbi:hypothetical protein F5X68DRAFT_261156 [Plectosphaerella plurivora]|uniref:Uncharacterized protein n=1 Tax=Plectosphaerella plurivora TaxID=936078 RepID=A0A9P8VDZ8_9PEZI|nr:hypothetical protein F5X68DRAFT_261156 [Plectosphaerella plurivora]
MAAPGSTPLLAEGPSPSADTFTPSERRPLLTQDVYFLPATTCGEDHGLLDTSSDSSPSPTQTSTGNSSPVALPDSPPPRQEHGEGFIYHTVPAVLEPSPSSPSSDYGSSPSPPNPQEAGVLEMRDHLENLLNCLAIGLGDDADMLDDEFRGVITEHLNMVTSEPPPLAVFVQDIIQTLLRKDYAPDGPSWLDSGLQPLPRAPFVRKFMVRHVLKSTELRTDFLAFLTTEHKKTIDIYRTLNERTFK